MHSLDVIHERNAEQVVKEFTAAVEGDNYILARKIAKANPDLYWQDGRRRVPSHKDEGGEA